MGNIPTTVERDFVQVVVLGGQPNFVNQVGEIDIDHLMGIRAFINKIAASLSHFSLLLFTF